ncbi:MAG: ornithine carbamoyltransferase, partial [Acidimicrobiia bacterium]|nr:ornithine carbamoyltransferase [Acidimicrobiia bacterium]
MSDFISVTDLGHEGLASVLELAASVKKDRGAVSGSRSGRTVGLFFEKPSTRTRVSCEVASVDVGMHPVVLKRDEVGLGSREAVSDVARVLDRYLDALAFRVFDHRHLVEIAEHAAAPVINLLSDLEHPCQAVADLQTVAEHRDLPGTVLTYVGDGNNVAHSLMLAGAMMGMEVRVAHPDGYAPSVDVTEEASRIAAAHGGGIRVGTEVDDLVAGADVVYTDVWASMGQEDEAADRAQTFERYRVDERLFALAADDAIFLHCLPAHRGEEVTHEVLEHDRSFVFDQAENRLHAFK